MSSTRDVKFGNRTSQTISTWSGFVILGKKRCNQFVAIVWRIEPAMVAVASECRDAAGDTEKQNLTEMKRGKCGKEMRSPTGTCVTRRRIEGLFDRERDGIHNGEPPTPQKEPWNCGRELNAGGHATHQNTITRIVPMRATRHHLDP